MYNIIQYCIIPNNTILYLCCAMISNRIIWYCIIQYIWYIIYQQSHPSSLSKVGPGYLSILESGYQDQYLMQALCFKSKVTRTMEVGQAGQHFPRLSNLLCTTQKTYTWLQHLDLFIQNTVLYMKLPLFNVHINSYINYAVWLDINRIYFIM